MLAAACWAPKGFTLDVAWLCVAATPDSAEIAVRRAIVCHRKSVAVAEALDDKVRRNIGLCNLGQALSLGMKPDLEGALRHLQQVSCGCGLSRSAYMPDPPRATSLGDWHRRSKLLAAQCLALGKCT